MPTPVATVKWSERSESEVVNGNRIDRTISRTYLVVDAESEAAAKTAVGLPAINAEFNPGSRFRARGRQITARLGPTTWDVRVDYGVPENGSYPTDEIDPLLRPTVLTWGTVSVQRPMEKDRGQTPVLIRNSAGDMFDPLPVEDYEFDTLTATKWFPFYDRSLRRKFVGKVNASNWTINDTTFLPGEVFVKSILPTSSSELALPGAPPKPASYVQVALTLWLDNDSRAAADKSGDPFDVHIVDQGLRGWYEGTGGRKRGWFCTVVNPAASELVVEAILTAPVLLDGRGRPLDPLIKVAAKPEAGGKAYAPAEPPDSMKTTFPFLPDRVSQFDKPGVDGVRQWRFYKALAANLNELPF